MLAVKTKNNSNKQKKLYPLFFYKDVWCKNRSELDTNVGVRPDAKTEFNRTVKRS